MQVDPNSILEQQVQNVLKFPNGESLPVKSFECKAYIYANGKPTPLQTFFTLIKSSTLDPQFWCPFGCGDNKTVCNHVVLDLSKQTKTRNIVECKAMVQGNILTYYRRLTITEKQRCMGMPDGYTNVENINETLQSQMIEIHLMCQLLHIY
jgi:hypothetical protein